MPRLRLFLVLLVALATAPAALGQRSAPWRVYRMADGLAEPACVSVTLGSRGKVIVGHATQPFAAEIDGFDVRSIPAPARLPLRYYQSPGGQLWTVAHQGLLEYRSETWITHPIPEIAEALAATGLSHLEIRLWPVRQGLVLFLLPRGLFAYNNESAEGERVQLVLEASATPLKVFTGLCGAQAGGLWVSGEGGLLRFTLPSKASNSPPQWQAYKPTRPWSHFREPREDDAGMVTMLAQEMATGQPGIARFGGQDWEFETDVPEGLRGAWRAADRTSWAFSATTLYQWHEGRPITPYEDLSVKRIEDVVIEPRGNFWLATSDGLYRYSPALWRRPAAVAGLETPVLALTPGASNSVWFLTGGAWHQVTDRRRVEIPLRLPGERLGFTTAEGVYVEATGSLASEVDGALLQVVVPTEGPARAELRAAPGSYRCLGSSADGLLVVAQDEAVAGAELFRFTGVSLEPLLRLPRELELGQRLVRCYTARNGNLWISGNAGLAVFRDGKWESFGSPGSLSPEAALAFAEVGENRLWCATPARLWEFDGRGWAVLREGVDRLQGLLWTRNGTGWLALDSGVQRQLPTTWLELTMEDGLPGLDVSQLVEDQRGRVWAATSHGLSVYYPGADPDAPRTRIEELSERERNIPETGAITIAFQAEDKWKFTSRHRLLYSYRLDERDWSGFSEVTRVSFGDLAPGNHYFQVRSMDRNGNVDAKPPTIEFFVVLPWYKEGRLLVTASAGVAIALFFAVLAVNRHWRLLRSYAEVEQKVAERTRQLESANRELLQSQKMTALGTLAAGIAHDFNNILSIIKGSAQIIEDNLENQEKVRTRVDRIKTVVDQGAGIVKAMLGFSRDSAVQLAHANDIVADTVRLLGDRFLREVQVTVRPGVDLPPTRVSKDLVQQILLNFIFNAAEAMTERREVILETSRLSRLPEQPVLSPASAPVYIRIAVHDFGCGISQEHLPRIFEPFFTTKAFSTRRGTGLGLSMVYRLASRMEAGLAVETEVNRGSTFSLILPVREEPAEARASSVML